MPVAQSDARLSGYQEVTGSVGVASTSILLWGLIMKYFLRTVSPCPLIQEGQLSIFLKECAQVLVNRLENLACQGKVWLGKLTGSA